MKYQGRRARADAVLNDRWHLAASLSGLVSLAEIKEAPSTRRDVRAEEGGSYLCALRIGAAQKPYTVRWPGVNYACAAAFSGREKSSPPMDLGPALP